MCLIFLLLLVQSEPPREAKAPVPDAAALKEAEKLIREVFKDDYVRNAPTDRKAFARKLLRQAAETRDAPSARFVLLREAREVAAKAGDPALALQAIDEMGKHFQIDAISMKLAALSAAAPPTEVPKVLVDLLLKLADEAGASEDYETAERAATGAVAAARKAKDIPLVNRSEAKLRETGELKARRAEVRKAAEIIAKNPADPGANLVLGRFLCFTKEDWDRGLPHLLKGTDEALSALAAKDLSKPVEAADQAATGNGWWELAEKVTGDEKASLLRRAASWYRLALPGLAGLSRVKAEKRLEAAPAPPRAELDLLSLIAPQKDAVLGEWLLRDGALISTRSPFRDNRIQIPYEPPDEYDLTVVAEKKEGVEGLGIGLASQGRQYALVVDGWSGTLSGLHLIDGKLADQNGTAVRGGLIGFGKQATIACRVRKEGVSFSVNGKMILDWKGSFDRLSVMDPHWKVPNPRALFIHCTGSTFHFTRITLVPVSDPGKSVR